MFDSLRQKLTNKKKEKESFKKEEASGDALHHFQHAKYHLNSQIDSSDPADFRVSGTKWPNPFLAMPTQTILEKTLAFLTFYLHAKNQFIPTVHS